MSKVGFKADTMYRKLSPFFKSNTENNSVAPLDNSKPLVSVTPPLSSTNGDTFSHAQPNTFTPLPTTIILPVESYSSGGVPPQYIAPKRSLWDKFINVALPISTISISVIMAIATKSLWKGFFSSSKSIFQSYEHDPTITKLSELPGMDKAKEIFKRKVIDPSKNSSLYKKENVQPCGFFLLWGEPGVGKTNFVYSAAKEVKAKVTTFKLSEEGSSYINGTTMQIHKKALAVVKEAKKNPKEDFFVLIDEIEALLGEGKEINDEKVKDIKTLLQTFDMFKRYNNIKVFATTNETFHSVTNKVGTMNQAATDRFDIKIHIPKPDFQARIDAIRFLLKKYPSAKELLNDKQAIEEIARSTDGCSYRILNQLLNHALEMMMTDKLRLVKDGNPDEIKLTKKYWEIAIKEMKENAN